MVNCIGEAVPNLRLLTRRFSEYIDFQMIPGTDFVWIDWNNLYQHHDFINRLAGSFGFVTGGLRVQFTVLNTATLELVPPGQFIGAYTRYLDAVCVMGAEYMASVKAGNTVIVQAPYQHVVPFLPIKYMRDGSVSFNGPSVEISVPTEDGVYTLRASLAASDDFSFGWQVGPPGFALAGDLSRSNFPAFEF